MTRRRHAAVSMPISPRNPDPSEGPRGPSADDSINGTRGRGIVQLWDAGIPRGGRPLVAFGAASGHCALYPMNPATIDTHRRLLGKFETSKGTIRFNVSQPLPASVVRTLVKARLQDVTASPAPARRQPVPRRSALSSPGSGTAPVPVRSYFARLPAGARGHMQKLRAAIRAAAPGAVESFGYGMPAFTLDGKGLVWYAAWKHHSSLYPISQTTARTLAADLAAYATSGKGTIQVSPRSANTEHAGQAISSSQNRRGAKDHASHDAQDDRSQEGATLMTTEQNVRARISRRFPFPAEAVFDAWLSPASAREWSKT